MFPTIEDLASAVGVIAFTGGIILYLFRTIVTKPLQKSIEQLNKTIERIQDEHSKTIERVSGRIEVLEKNDTRQDERIHTLFERIEGR